MALWIFKKQQKMKMNCATRLKRILHINQWGLGLDRLSANQKRAVQYMLYIITIWRFCKADIVQHDNSCHWLPIIMVYNTRPCNIWLYTIVFLVFLRITTTSWSATTNLKKWSALVCCQPHDDRSGAAAPHLLGSANQRLRCYPHPHHRPHFHNRSQVWSCFESY